MVSVGPPLFASGLSTGSTPTRLPFTPFARPHEFVASSTRLWPPSLIPAPVQSPPEGLLATTVLVTTASVPPML